MIKNEALRMVKILYLGDMVKAKQIYSRLYTRISDDGSYVCFLNDSNAFSFNTQKSMNFFYFISFAL